MYLENFVTSSTSADGLEWYIGHLGVRYVFHYLDDFLVAGPPTSPECADALVLLDRACAQLGIPIAEHKRESLTTCLTFLGIEVDTVSGQLRLPADKFEHLKSLLLEWGDRKACQRRDLDRISHRSPEPCVQSRALWLHIFATNVEFPPRGAYAPAVPAPYPLE